MINTFEGLEHNWCVLIRLGKISF